MTGGPTPTLLSPSLNRPAPPDPHPRRDPCHRRSVHDNLARKPRLVKELSATLSNRLHGLAADLVSLSLESERPFPPGLGRVVHAPYLTHLLVSTSRWPASHQLHRGHGASSPASDHQTGSRCCLPTVGLCQLLVDFALPCRRLSVFFSLHPGPSRQRRGPHAPPCRELASSQHCRPVLICSSNSDYRRYHDHNHHDVISPTSPQSTSPPK